MDMVVLRLLVLDELCPNLQSIHTIIGPCWYAEQHQIVAFVEANPPDEVIDE